MRRLALVGVVLGWVSASCSTMIGVATRGNSSGSMSGIDQDFKKSKVTGLKEVVDDEDVLRALAAREMGCSAEMLEVSEVEAADVPVGWAAAITGCDRSAIYKVHGRDGWTRQ